MTIIYLLSSVFTLCVLGLILFKYFVSFSKLKNIKNPVRQLTAEEVLYLEPYLVNAMKLRDNNVYQVTGGGISVETTRAQGNTLAKLKFEDMEVVFPYYMEAFIDDVNTMDLVVVNDTIGHLVGPSGLKQYLFQQ